MSDLQVLQDAFTELERRADNAESRPATGKARMHRLVPVAAAVLVVAGLVTAVALLAPGGEPGRPAPVGTDPDKPTSTSHPPAHHPGMPSDPDTLTERFRVVLGKTATFTVTDTGPPGDGAAIVGILTAGGRRGGYDIQFLMSYPGAPAWCDAQAHCKISTLADGSSLAVSTDSLAGPDNAAVYQVNLIRKDGVEILMHVANEQDSTGGYDVTLSPKPPLTTDQMVAIVTSRKW